MVTTPPASDEHGRLQSAATANPAELSVGRDDSISVLDLLIALAEAKQLIFSITTAFAIVAIIVSLLLPKSYTATVTLLPPQQNSSMSNQLALQLGSTGGVATTLAGGAGLLKNPNDTYVAMFKSRTVEDAMVDRFDLMREYHKKYRSDARKTLERYATVDGSGKDSLIHISVEDRDPQRAAALANGFVDQFRDLSQHLAITEAQQRRQFFENQLQQANQNLADSEEALKETEQKTGLIQLDSQVRALIDSAAAIRAQIAAKEVQIQGMQTYATGANAQLVEAEQELAGLRSQLAKLGGTSDNPDGIIVPKGQMTAAGMEYVRRLRDVKYYETIFDILARQFELAKLDEAKEGALIQIVDHAVPPDRRSFPKRGVLVLSASIFGFLFGALVALIRAGIEHMQYYPEKQAKFLRLRQILSWNRNAR